METCGHKNADAIPLHRVALLKPFTNILENIGALNETEFRSVRLTRSILEDVNNFIPSYSYYNFISLIGHHQGITDFGFRAAEALGANSLDPNLKGCLDKAPTLFRGLSKVIELCKKSISNCRIGLVEPKYGGHLHFEFVPSCKRDNPAFDDLSWFGLRIMIDTVRAFAGQQWLPNEIGIMNGCPSSHHIREQLGNTRIQPKQEYCYIVLDYSLMSAPPVRNEDRTSPNAPLDYEPVALDLAGSIRQLISSNLGIEDVNIDLIANLACMSSRTLQRRLEQSGTNFSEVLDCARFNTASKLLKNPEAKVAEIAHLTGYQNSTHFARAFRRIAGVSPTSYRKAKDFLQPRITPSRAPVRKVRLHAPTQGVAQANERTPKN